MLMGLAWTCKKTWYGLEFSPTSTLIEMPQVDSYDGAGIVIVAIDASLEKVLNFNTV